MVFLYRVPYSQRITISSCVAADSELFVDEFADEVAKDVDEVAKDVDEVEKGTWVDIALDALGLISVVVLVIVVAVKKTSVGASPPLDAREDAGSSARDARDDVGTSARGAGLPPRRLTRRDTVFELPIESVRV